MAQQVGGGLLMLMLLLLMVEEEEGQECRSDYEVGRVSQTLSADRKITRFQSVQF
jgi:hypothetical protein